MILWFIYLCVYLLVYLFIYLSVYLSIYWLGVSWRCFSCGGYMTSDAKMIVNCEWEGMWKANAAFNVALPWIILNYWGKVTNNEVRWSLVLGSKPGLLNTKQPGVSGLAFVLLKLEMKLRLFWPDCTKVSRSVDDVFIIMFRLQTVACR